MELFEKSHYRIDYTLTSFLGEIEGNRYIQNILADVVDVGEENETEKVVGKMSGVKLLLGNARSDNENLFYIFDTHQWLIEVGEQIMDFEKQDFKGNIEWFFKDDLGESDILILNEIELLPQYRGLKLAPYLIKDFYNNFQSGAALFLLNFQQKTLDVEGKRKLTKYALEIGFATVPAVDSDLLFLNLAWKNEPFGKYNLI